MPGMAIAVRSGEQTRQVQMVCLDELVGADDLLRRVERLVSWETVRAFYDRNVSRLLPGVLLHRFCDLRFHSVEVEARALLHGRILDRGHCQLGDFLLHEDKAPELIHE